jgi:hypothetical protein
MSASRRPVCRAVTLVYVEFGFARTGSEDGTFDSRKLDESFAAVEPVTPPELAEAIAILRDATAKAIVSSPDQLPAELTAAPVEQAMIDVSAWLESNC